EGEVAADGPDIFHPADDLHVLAHMLHAELVAIMGTGLHHGYDPSFECISCYAVIATSLRASQ
ncbi:MAG: hypothetical protein IJ365_03780, partial [Clostridia bacterium]|nr:hypothetical protein [Clostridia bacterium]